MVAHGNERPASGRKRVRPTHDWTRSVPSENLTEFQRFTRDDVDWQKSPLGPMHQWPCQLRQMVLVIIADPAPAVVLYGDPEEVAIVYNEAYTGLIGSKHPKLQGQLARTELKEAWNFDKLLHEQLETGLTTVGEAHPVLLHRHGFLEESFFSFRFIPVICPEEGCWVGSYATATEHTAEVLYERRIATVRTLDSEVVQANTLESLWQAIMKALAVNEHDVPLAILYSVEPSNAVNPKRRSVKFAGRQACILEGNLGIEQGHKAAPACFDLESNTYELAGALRETAKRLSPLVLRKSDNTLPTQLFEGIQWRGHGVPCEAAVICAIRDDSDKSTIGFLIVGLSPRRPYDAPYQDFIQLLTKQVATPHVSKIRLREQVEAGRLAATQAALERVWLDEQLAAKTAAFEHAELKFSRFADRLPMGVGIADEQGRVLYGNSVWRHFVGVAEDSTEPLDLLKCAESDQEELVWKLWADLQAKKPVKALLRLKTSWTAPDGQQHPMTVLVTAYTDVNHDGGMTYMSCVADVSELKWIEAQVRQRTAEVEQSELKYRKFAGLAPVGVCILGQDRLVQFANQSFFTIMAHQVPSKDVLTSIHPNDVERVKTSLASLINVECSVTFECRLLKHPPSQDATIPFNSSGPWEEDSPAWILASAHLEECPETHIILWVTDITVQKTAQNVIQRRMNAALEMKRQQEHFIGTV